MPGHKTRRSLVKALRARPAKGFGSSTGMRRRSRRASTMQKTAVSQHAAARALEEAKRVQAANDASKKELMALSKQFEKQMKGLGVKKRHRRSVDIDDLESAMKGVGVKAKSRARAATRRKRTGWTKKKKTKKTSPVGSAPLFMKPATFSVKSPFS